MAETVILLIGGGFVGKPENTQTLLFFLKSQKTGKFERNVFTQNWGKMIINFLIDRDLIRMEHH